MKYVIEKSKTSLVLIAYGVFLLLMGALGALAGSLVSGMMGTVFGMLILSISQIKKRGIWDWIPPLLLMIVFFIRSIKTGKWAPIALALVSSIVLFVLFRLGTKDERKAI